MGMGRNDFNNDDDFDFDGDFDFDDNEFDDESDIDFNDNFGGDFSDDFDDDLDFDDNEGDSENRGPSRAFIIIAALMVLLFVIGIGALIFVVTRETGPTPFEQTSVAIEATNEETIRLGQMTETQSYFDGLTATQNVLNITATANAPTATPTATVTPSTTPSPTADSTEQALLQLTLDAAQQTADAEALLTQQSFPTETPQGVSADAYAQTATALAGLLNNPTADPGIGGGGFASPTPEGWDGNGGQLPTSFAPLPTALPDTGLFDDLAAGGGSTGLIMLAVAGLIGLIFFSRWMRNNTNA